MGTLTYLDTFTRLKFTPFRAKYRNSYQRYIYGFEKSGCETKRGRDLLPEFYIKGTDPKKGTDPIGTCNFSWISTYILTMMAYSIDES